MPDSKIKTSKPEKSIMEKDKMGPFYYDEFGILFFVPLFLGGVIGNTLMSVFDISGMKVIMVIIILESLLLWWIMVNRKIKPKGYIMQTLYTDFDIFRQRLGYMRFKDSEKRMRSYDSVKRTRYYN